MNVRVGMCNEFYGSSLCHIFLAVEFGDVNNWFQGSHFNLLLASDVCTSVTQAECTKDGFLFHYRPAHFFRTLLFGELNRNKYLDSKTNVKVKVYCICSFCYVRSHPPDLLFTFPKYISVLYVFYINKLKIILSLTSIMNGDVIFSFRFQNPLFPSVHPFFQAELYSYNCVLLQ